MIPPLLLGVELIVWRGRVQSLLEGAVVEREHQHAAPLDAGDVVAGVDYF